ncbi:hypothetical protein Hdeb2414_s0012g00393791 [Helianthus debilis subsp. tardiflorus]
MIKFLINIMTIIIIDLWYTHNFVPLKILLNKNYDCDRFDNKTERKRAIDKWLLVTSSRNAMVVLRLLQCHAMVGAVCSVFRML